MPEIVYTERNRGCLADEKDKSNDGIRDKTGGYQDGSSCSRVKKTERTD